MKNLQNKIEILKKIKIDEQKLNEYCPIPLFLLEYDCLMPIYYYKQNAKTAEVEAFKNRDVLLKGLFYILNKPNFYKFDITSDLYKIVETYGLKIEKEAINKLCEYILHIYNKNKIDNDIFPSILINKNNSISEEKKTYLTFKNSLAIDGKEYYIYYVKFLNSSENKLTPEFFESKYFILSLLALNREAISKKDIKIGSILISEKDVIIPSYWNINNELIDQINEIDLIKRYLSNKFSKLPENKNNIEEFKRISSKKNCKYCLYREVCCEKKID